MPLDSKNTWPKGVPHRLAQYNDAMAILRSMGVGVAGALLMALWLPLARAAFLSIFDEEQRAISHLKSPPVLGEVAATGFGDKKSPVTLRVSLASTKGARRSDVARVFWQAGAGPPLLLQEGRGLVFESSTKDLRLPLKGFVAADTVDNTRTVRPLCWLKESYLAAKRPEGDCWAALANAPELAENLGLNERVLTSPRGGFAKGAVLVALSFSRAPETLSLFAGDPTRDGADFTAWASVHFTPATGACAVAPAKAVNLALSLTEDTLRARCRQEKNTVTFRLSHRLWDGHPPSALTVVALAHEGGFTEDTQVLDLLPPTRLEAPR